MNSHIKIMISLLSSYKRCKLLCDYIG